MGIGIGAGSGDKVVFNSISMTGDLDPSGTDQRSYPVALLGPDPQVVLEQHGLAVEDKGGEGGLGLDPVDQIVEHRHEAREEAGARQVPLAVPVGVGDEVKDERRHARKVLGRAAPGLHS